jgi:hypothetical protein
MALQAQQVLTDRLALLVPLALKDLSALQARLVLKALLVRPAPQALKVQ